MRALALLLALTGPAAAAESAAVRTARSEARLVSDQEALLPGTKSWLAFVVTPEPGWHVYWRNPGDSGSATRFKWKHSKLLEPGLPVWPFPERIPVGPLLNYGFNGELVLPVPLETFEHGQRELRRAWIELKAEWLVCQEECVPGFATFKLEMPTSYAQTPSPWAPKIAAALRKTPKPAPADWTLRAERAGDTLRLRGLPRGVWEFFPYDDLVLDNAAPQEPVSGGLDLAAGAAPAPRLRGIVVRARQEAFELDLPLRAAPESFLLLALFAFLGGLLLNLMPCVFPVLSIKILGFLEHSKDRAQARAHGLAYAAGVVTSFLLLAVGLLALRALGARIGWGFQLQSPWFLAALAALFTLLGLNLLGVFEIGTALTRVRGRGGSFATGVLAVVVATPCTAPFMGAALGAALTLPAPAALALFLCLGLGMALPYVALTWFPAGLKLLPRPGAWMDTLKKALALPLFLTAAWLLWVLGLNLGWLGRSDAGLKWRAFERAAVASLNAEGKSVFVDFTAAWCVTCQVNKRTTLTRADVVAAFEDSGVVPMRADWTRYDAAITAELERLGRSGVPVYALYRPGAPAPQLLPTVLTPALVLDALKP